MPDNVKDYTQLMRDIELYQYFENNYCCNDKVYFIVYPPGFCIPLKANTKEELLSDFFDIANDFHKICINESKNNKICG